ncbi:iron chelate uptake ABC transporter family permease subunit, partial [Staphylococcus cohnii]|uniref:iron chelate uptake ABC transporter family permease subunit n=1 Tax=Staphylococcus cohnii TaxID=29382 RepID=UPI0011A16310
KMWIGSFFKRVIGEGEYRDSLIVMEFGFGRMVISILGGGGLGMSGGIIESVCKKGLGEGGILGINGGSGFGIGLLIVVGQVNVDNFV